MTDDRPKDPRAGTLPRIAVLSLGGTIAMIPSADGGVAPALSASDLVAAVPGLGAVAAVEARSFRQLPGAHLTFDDLDQLAEAVEAAVAGGADGVVVTQGTDTIEETAFVLDLLLGGDAPVVVTGAMRNPSLAGADGPANLLAAVRVAAAPAARRLGALVVLNDTIHAARFVHKAHSSRPDAFSSAPAGPLGALAEDRVAILARLDRHPPLPPAPPVAAPEQPRVGLVRLGIDDDGRLVDAAVAAGFAGLVVEGLGGGHASPLAAAAMERAAATLPVVLATRTGRGGTLRNTYGFVGGEIDLARRGVLPAGRLDGVKARVLLTLLLRRGAGREVIRSWFDSFA